MYGAGDLSGQWKTELGIIAGEGVRLAGVIADRQNHPVIAEFIKTQDFGYSAIPAVQP